MRLGGGPVAIVLGGLTNQSVVVALQN